MNSQRYLIAIQSVIALEWLISGWSKFASPAFSQNIGQTLQNFAAKTSFPSYAIFLKSVGIPNADLMANLVRFGELSVSITLIISGIIFWRNGKLPVAGRTITGIALLGGTFLNLNFYLAASSTSPSTAGINLVMGLIQLTLALYYLTLTPRPNK